MKTTVKERRLIENEMIFRRMNEKVGDDLEALSAMHIDDGTAHLIKDEDFLLRFKCECTDENCELRIPMKLSTYQDVHSNRDTFIVLPGHQVDTIEETTKRTKNYWVVQKNNSTPEPSDILNDTPIDNS